RGRRALPSFPTRTLFRSRVPTEGHRQVRAAGRARSVEAVTAPARARSGMQSSTLVQTVDIETPELVTFSYTIAGVGSRVAAALRSEEHTSELQSQSNLVC